MSRCLVRPVILLIDIQTCSSILTTVRWGLTHAIGPTIRIVEVTRMTGKRKKKAPEIVFRGGKPSAVILDIDEYRELLERLEDVEDLKMLEDMRKKPLRFKSLDNFLKEYASSV